MGNITQYAQTGILLTEGRIHFSQIPCTAQQVKHANTMQRLTSKGVTQLTIACRLGPPAYRFNDALSETCLMNAVN